MRATSPIAFYPSTSSRSIQASIPSPLTPRRSAAVPTFLRVGSVTTASCSRPTRHYYKGEPKIKELDLLLVPDSNTQETLLRSGGADLAIDATASFYNNIADDRAVTRQLVPAPGFWGGLLLNLKRPPLDDPAARHAIASAVDAKMRSSQKSTYHGTASLPIADLTAFSWAYPGGLQPTAYSPAHAKALLEADGWKVGIDGIRTKNGSRLALQLTYGLGSASVHAMVAQLQQTLREVGIDAQLRGYEYQLLYGSIQTGGIFNSGKFDMAMYSWVAGADPDESSQWLCAMTPQPVITFRTTAPVPWMRPKRWRSLPSTGAVRKAAYRKIEELLLTDAPTAFLYQQRQRYVYAAGLKKLHPQRRKRRLECLRVESIGLL